MNDLSAATTRPLGATGAALRVILAVLFEAPPVAATWPAFCCATVEEAQLRCRSLPSGWPTPSRHSEARVGGPA